MGEPNHQRNAARAGDVLDGRYRLVERLGHGGFGDVWRAEELLPDGAPFRSVALKLLISSGSDASDWAEEAKLLASFRHPSLVTIYAAGILAVEPPQRFVAMELLLGQNLSDVLRARGNVPWRRVLSWAAHAAAALDLIHAAGVVHLDLKPANLFLCEGGALKVLDFGIARRAGVSAVLPRRGDRLPARVTTREAELATGLFIAGRADDTLPDDAFAATRPVSPSGSPRVVIGTPGFMAPEVLDLGEPTAAADAYALAVCVVQLVTGHLPLAAPDEPVTWDDPTAVSAWLDQIRTATLRGMLRPIDAAEMGLPRGVAALMKRLLAVDPAERKVTPGKLGSLFDEVWERPHGVPDPPYFGLAPFSPEAEGLLFGRDDDLARLGRELTFEPAVVLQGPEGAGKSSLAIAGLVPYLARGGADGKDDWIAVTITIAAGDDPDAILDAALSRASLELRGAEIEALSIWCERSPIGLVILVDPLDALIAAPPAPGSAARLSALITGIAAGPTRPGLRLVATVREERVSALQETAAGASLRAALRYVGPPPAGAVKDMVGAPAHYAGVPVIDVDRIAADVQRELRQGGVRLPYVALSLADFWGARGRVPVSAKGATPPSSSPSAPPPSGALLGDRWAQTGGVRGAVVRHAERVFAGFEGAARATAEEILLRLSTTDGRALRWPEAELAAMVAAGETEPVLARLAAQRLVLRTRGEVEIGHEALLTEWPTLASARLAHMDRLLFLERLREARLSWERADNHKDFLLHGALLEEVRLRAETHARWIARADAAFVAASLGRARVRRAGRWAAGALLAAMVGGGLWARELLEDAREAEARARAATIELEQLAELAARARRTDDPYQRVAFAAAAMERGSRDGLLPLEIAAAAANVARASFFTLEHLDAPAFPWDDRYLLGWSSATTLSLVDFRPAEPDVIEDFDLDFDPDQADAVHFKMPVVRKLRPHEAPIVERVAFSFTTAFATRATDGEVKVFRVRDDGLPVLAAIAPMRCAGAMHVAEEAPVLACATDRGLARWDLRRARGGDASAVAHHPFPGTVSDVSPAGDRVIAITQREALFWSPDAGTAVLHRATRPIAQAALSPRDDLVALLGDTALEIVDAAGTTGAQPRAPLFTVPLRGTGPHQMRWDPGGLDIAVCYQGRGRFHYLKRGGRAKDDPPPRGEPCTAPRPRNQPEPIRGPDDYVDLGARDLGTHRLDGGFRLRKKRFLSRDLVLFDASPPPAVHGLPPQLGPLPPAASRLLRFEGRDEVGGEEVRGAKESIVAVERDDATVMFQVADELRFYTVGDGSRLFARKGNFLRRCPDGRYLAWRAQGARYVLLDGWTDHKLGEVPREPGLVVGADSACATLYTQRLDGTLVAHAIDGSAPARALGTADGFVHLVKPSAAGPGVGAGFWLAFSSGAVARLDEAEGSLRVVAYATPRATALADGPEPGEVVFADPAGVMLVRRGAAPTWLRDGGGGVEWEDLSVSRDKASLLLASDDRVAVIDLVRRELLGSMPMEGRGRFARWDDDGSVLLWAFARTGGAEGAVIPRGVAMARGVSAAISNLVVEKGRIAIKR